MVGVNVDVVIVAVVVAIEGRTIGRQSTRYRHRLRGVVRWIRQVQSICLCFDTPPDVLSDVPQLSLTSIYCSLSTTSPSLSLSATSYMYEFAITERSDH